MSTRVTTQSGQVTNASATRTTALLCIAAFMTMLDLFIVNVAFESIGGTYPGSSLAALSWVLNAYIVVYAACLIPAGSLCDRYGRKLGFLVGLALFTIASVGCAVAPTLGLLIICRVAQAAGAAALTPASLGLILTVLPESRRAGAVKVWATTSAFSAAVGPVVGGLLAETSWRWAFLLNLPVGLVAFVVAVRLIPTSAPSSHARVPDPVGAIAIAVAIGGLSMALVKAKDWGGGSTQTLLTVVVVLVASALLVYRVRTHPAPVISPRLLRVPSFAVANITTLLFTSAFSALFLSVSLWLTTAAGYGPLQAGLALVPGPLLVPLFAAATQRWAGSIQPRFVISTGLALVGLGSLLLAARGGMHYASDILPGWLITAVGIGIAMPTLIGSATADLSTTDAATGSAVVNTARQAGYALGVAGLVAILGTHASLSAGEAYKGGWIFVTAMVLIGALAALGIRQQAHRQTKATR